MSETVGKSLYLSVCDCPHVNLVIADADGHVEGHFAASADKAEAIAHDLLQLAAECRARARRRLPGHPAGRA